MVQKMRVSILYNQPVSGSPDKEPMVVSAEGALGDPPAIRRGEKRTLQEYIDMSEVGVVEEMDDIKDALNSIGYETTTFNVDSDVPRLIDYLRGQRPDMIFNLVECIGNQSIHEMHVAGLYELMGIPYTGAPPLALGLALNKPRVKELLLHNGIRTPRFKVFDAKDKLVAGDLSYPLIVKPSREDASVGIDDKSVVYSSAELKRRVQYILHEFDQPALAEEYIDGRELNVAILGALRPEVLPISEIDFSGLTAAMHKIVSYEAKWIQGTVAYEGTKGVCPAVLTPRQTSAVKAMALQAFHLIGCRDYARVDFRLSSNGTPYVLEVNPNPDISADAGFARSTRAAGLSYPEAIGRIVESARERTGTA